MNYSKRNWIFVPGMLALLLLVSGCKPKPPKPQPTPPPPKPVTATLSANPSSIQSGQSATLSWSTENATDITLEGNKVDANGSQTVSPTQTTTYHLTAKGAGGTQDATAQVTVTAPPTPTPTPTPAPSLTDEEIFDQSVKDVYFDYDKADLRPESQQTLVRSAEVIKAHPNWQVRIEGNCDERGSIEYNLALGVRRADSAQQALLQAGVSPSQLHTTSLGKEKPVCTESNEDCWQRNRHDHFVLAH